MLLSARAMGTLENLEKCLRKLKRSNSADDFPGLEESAIELENEAYRLLTEVNSLYLLRHMREIKRTKEA